MSVTTGTTATRTSRRRTARALLTAATAVTVAAGVTLAVAGPAHADPVRSPSALTIPVECDNGESYLITVAGGSPFPPGHAVGSTAVLVPTAFSGLRAVVSLPDGTVLSDTTTAARSKGNSATTAATSVACQFEVSFPGEGGVVITVSETIHGKVTGPR